MKNIQNTIRETLALFLCALLIFSPQVVLAQAPVASGATSTTVTNAANGVPVVNIAAPNGSGLSHNTFTSYNVDAIGLVLNNGDKSQMFRQSQLAGQVAGNSNLAAGNQAHIILNEVTGSNRSILAGFTEVLGGKADLILANPFGITTNGAGFINTDRVSLVTGTPNITGGALSGFSVNGGDILITGNGLNASAQQMLDLVSRQISVEGQINAQNLNLIAGRNNWDQSTNIATALSADGSTAPAFSIDSSVLGGMYAGRISLKSMENGVGVRTLGEAAATATDFTINAAGKIEIRSQLSANRDLVLTSTSVRDDAIDANEASLTAARNLGLNATNGGATLNGGVLVANNNLTYNLGTLTDTATATAITDNNKRYAGGAMTLNGTGAWNINDVNYGTAGAFSATAGSMSLSGITSGSSLSSGSNLDLRATTGDLILGSAVLQSAGHMSITSDIGQLDFAAGAKAQSTIGTLSLASADSLTNVGILTADAGDVYLHANGIINNFGTIHAAGLLDIADKDAKWTVPSVESPSYPSVSNTVMNSGTLQGGTLSLMTSSLSVRDGGSVESTGDMSLLLGTQLTIDSSSRIVAAASGSGTATIKGYDNDEERFGGLINFGMLYSGQDLDVRGGIENTLTGTIGATGNINLKSPSKLINAGNIVSSNGGVSLDAHSWSALLTNSGTISAAGLLQVSHGSTIAMSNTGKMLGDTVVIDADNLSVTGGGSIESAGDMTIDSYWGITIGGIGDTTSRILAATSGVGTGTFTSSDAYADSESVGNIYNYGILFSRENLILGGGDVENMETGAISALENLTFRAEGRKSHISNLGTFYAGQDLTIEGNLNNREGGIVYAGRDMYLRPNSRNDYSSLANWGRIEAINNASWLGRIVNYSQILAGNKFALQMWGANGLPSLNSGTIAAPTVSISGSGTFENTGTIKAITLDWSGTGELYNSATDEVATQSKDNETPSATPGAVTAQATSFPGLILTLPTSPNGMFIFAQNPNSHYLVESNPLYTNIDNFLGSDYLAEKYGFTPDELIKRLGDAAYETYLVEQQLISQAGTNLLKGYESEKEQMRGLMDQAGSQAATLGLVYGQALTATQQANLTGDMVWMVETTVNGQKVLAPVVYLAASTRKLFEPGGGVITADTIDMDLKSVTNKGGTISATALNITTKDDIKNVSGTIKGDDVSLTSTQGSIINQTAATRIPGSNISTVGKQATIESTGKLELDAAKDIRNLGAKMSAGGDASLTAGRDVIFDTVQEMTSTKSSSSGGNVFVRTSTSEASETTTQVKSSLTSGGNLSVKAKNDITLAGTDVEAKGNVALEADGDINLLARENTSATSKTTTQEGLFVSGGLYGTEKVTTGTFVSKNVGTTIKAGKDVSLDALKTVTIQGSEVQAEDNIEIFAEDVKVLAGKDVNRTTITTDTTSVLSFNLLGERSYKADAGASAEAEAEVSFANRTAKASAGAKANAAADGSLPSPEDAAAGIDPTGNSKSGADAKANASTGITSKTGVSAKANAEAGAEFEGDMELIGVDLVKKTTTTKVDETTKAVGSTLGAGKNITISARKRVTLQGAKVDARGDLELSGEDVDILAAEDKHTVSSSTSTQKAGVYISEHFETKAGAHLKNEYAVGTDGVNVERGVGISGGFDATQTIDVLRIKSVDTVTTDTKNVGSSMTSGGDLRINSGNKLTVQGSDITGGKDVEIKSKDMEFLAGKESHTTETTTSDTREGLYGESTVKVGAEAGDNLSFSGTGVKAGVNAEAKAEVKASLGIQGKNTYTRKTESNSKARVSTITSGSGSITRTAENRITDVGTDIEAAGDFNQSSKTFTSKAAADTSIKTSFAMTNSAKLGIYAGAAAGANVEVGASSGLDVPDANAGAKARVTGGVNAAYSGKLSDETETSSTAVVSSIKSGGKIKSITTGKTSLEGTLIEGNKGVELEAGSLDYSAAKDTTSKTSTSGAINAFVEVGAGVDAVKQVAVDFELAGDFKGNTKSESTSGAVAGGIMSGGNISIKTKGDTRLEGTSLTSAGDTNVAAGGNLVFDAARDTASSSEQGIAASASLTASKGKNMLGVGAKAAGSYTSASATSSEATAGEVNTGGKLNLSAGKAASFEGTIIDAGGDATISGKEGVTMSAARSTSSKQSIEVGGKVNLSGSKSTKDSETTKERNIGGALKVEIGSENESTAVGGAVKSGGDLKIVSGNNVTLEGTELEAGNKASIKAGGSVNLKAAESTSDSQGFGLSLAGEAKSKTITKTPGATTKNTNNTDTTSESDTAKPKNPGTGGTQGSDGSKKNDKALSTWQDKQAALLQEMREKKAAGTKDKESKTEDSKPIATGTTNDKETGPTKETEKKANIGLQIQTENASNKKGGSIKAGEGGVEIISGGGNVNMEGTKIETSGDANISAKKDVNITAAKSTESNFDLSLRAEAEQKTKSPNNSTEKPAPEPGGKSKVQAPEEAQKEKKEETKPGSIGPHSKVAETKTPATSEEKNDPNKSGSLGHIGIHFDSVVTDSQKSEINTGGKLNISSGGKTSLTDTKVKAENEMDDALK